MNEYGKLNGRLLVEPNDPEWRLLELDETIQEGDEFFFVERNSWSGSVSCGESVSEMAKDFKAVAYRRRKRQPQPASNWISVKERLPQMRNKYFPVASNGERLEDHYYDGKDWYNGIRSAPRVVTHWYENEPIIPPPPKQEPPPLPQGESDPWKEFVKSYDVPMGNYSNTQVWIHMKAAWNAALQQTTTK